MMKRKYEPIVCKDELIIGTGSVLIVCGWTLKEAVARVLTSDAYAVIGNLYSPTRGLSPLIRNLLANPQINTIATLGDTEFDRNAGAIKCFRDFIINGYFEGTSRSGIAVWKVNSSVFGQIDYDISDEQLTELRNSIYLLEPTNLKTVKYAIAAAKPKESNRTYHLVEPPQQVTSSAEISNVYGHVIRGNTIAETWRRAVERVLNNGRVDLDGGTKELLGAQLIVEAEVDEPEILEAWDSDRAFAENYISQFLSKDVVKVEGVKYSYGDRLRAHFEFDQIESAIERLKNTPTSRRVYLDLWDAKEDLNSNHPPCLVGIWVYLGEEGLDLIASFRANDILKAWPLNAISLLYLQKALCSSIGERRGRLITSIHNAHIYSEYLEEGQWICKKTFDFNKHDCNICNFRINLCPSSNGKTLIRLDALSPGNDGVVLDSWYGSTARSFAETFSKYFPNLSTDHALYLGIELSKAEVCLKEGIPYAQS